MTRCRRNLKTKSKVSESFLPPVRCLLHYHHWSYIPYLNEYRPDKSIVRKVRCIYMHNNMGGSTILHENFLLQSCVCSRALKIFLATRFMNKLCTICIPKNKRHALRWLVIVKTIERILIGRLAVMYCLQGFKTKPSDWLLIQLFSMEAVRFNEWMKAIWPISVQQRGFGGTCSWPFIVLLQL